MRTAGECDVQRAAAEQKDQEAEEQTAELQRLRRLSFSRKRSPSSCSPGQSRKKGKALEEKEVAI